jgi:8-oxo-dGTP diphosphatase
MARKKLRGDREPDVHAAGGVVVKRGTDLRRRVAVIHRPKYQDWSLPKGKLEPGEDYEQAALREVEEETGFRCETVRELDPVEYLDRRDRRKLVRYWLMRPLDGEFSSHDEVDDLRWLTAREAARELTYEHDRVLVRNTMQPLSRLPFGRS